MCMGYDHSVDSHTLTTVRDMEMGEELAISNRYARYKSSKQMSIQLHPHDTPVHKYGSVIKN